MVTLLVNVVLLCPIKDSFRELWNQIMSPRSGLELQSHRFRLRTYQNCFVGSELVDWLLTYEKTSTRYNILHILIMNHKTF